MHLNPARNTKLASIGERTEAHGLEEMNKEVRIVGRREEGRNQMDPPGEIAIFLSAESVIESSSAREKSVAETNLQERGQHIRDSLETLSGGQKRGSKFVRPRISESTGLLLEKNTGQLAQSAMCLPYTHKGLGVCSRTHI